DAVKAAIFMGDPHNIQGLSYNVGTCTAGGVSRDSVVLFCCWSRDAGHGVESECGAICGAEVGPWLGTDPTTPHLQTLTLASPSPSAARTHAPSLNSISHPITDPECHSSLPAPGASSAPRPSRPSSSRTATRPTPTAATATTPTRTSSTSTSTDSRPWP